MHSDLNCRHVFYQSFKTKKPPSWEALDFYFRFYTVNPPPRVGGVKKKVKKAAVIIFMVLKLKG
ncbi:MAG TPA: hypothetical protein DER18_14035 [Shewanella baltica]|nr:hypothetical protein [Shewanella baltica]